MADRPSVTPRPGGAKFVEPRFKDAGAFTKPTRKRVNPVSAAKRKKRAEAELAGVFKDVICRSNFECEAKLPGCKGRAMVMHHVLPRSAGGADAVENLLHICAFDGKSTGCHEQIHANPQRSYEAGFLRRRPTPRRLMETWPTDGAP